MRQLEKQHALHNTRSSIKTISISGAITNAAHPTVAVQAPGAIFSFMTAFLKTEETLIISASSIFTVMGPNELRDIKNSNVWENITNIAIVAFGRTQLPIFCFCKLGDVLSHIR